MLRGKRDRYHRLGFLIPFTVAAVAVPIQMVVGDQLARFVYQNEPRKFAAMELVPETSRNVPETIGGWLNEDGEVVGGISIPGLASFLSDPGQGTSTKIRGLESFPADERPTNRQATIVHWAWDVMIGLGTALFLLSAWFAVVWWRRRDLPRTKWFLRAAAVAGVASVVAMEAGWVVTEVGRQPWIVVDYMLVEDAATSSSGVWVTFLGIAALYTGVAVTTVLVLRAMRRRFDAADDRSDHSDGGGPYSPRIRPEPVGTGTGTGTGEA
jgi:cytochrome d ubiquinol oxidase subunit I